MLARRQPWTRLFLGRWFIPLSGIAGCGIRYRGARPPGPYMVKSSNPPSWRFARWGPRGLAEIGNSEVWSPRRSVSGQRR